MAAIKIIIKSYLKDIAGLLAIAVLLFTVSCSKQAETAQNPLELQPSLAITPTPTSTPEQNSPIRKIDFRNFTYPWTKGLILKEKTFTLKNGEIPSEFKGRIGVTLQSTKFADATGDGKEEALLFMSMTTGGSSSPGIFYVYSLEDGKPKLPWHFDTGDRADGGFKNTYVEGGNLIVELFGENKLENDEWVSKVPSGKDKGLCCPTLYTKTAFNWDGKQFVIEGTPEVFEIPQGN